MKVKQKLSRLRVGAGLADNLLDKQIAFQQNPPLRHERRGRNEATRIGLPITGLLGILLTAKQQGLIPLVQPILDDLIANGFWMREQLYAEVLQLAEE